MPCWADEQDRTLQNLVHKYIVNFQNIEPNYLFKVTQEHFPNFIGEGKSA